MKCAEILVWEAILITVIVGIVVVAKAKKFTYRLMGIMLAIPIGVAVCYKEES